MDIAPLTLDGLPVFTPLFGFSNITAPELQVEVHQFEEGNQLFSRKVIKRANVSPMTLTRGATFVDSDFWRWTMASLYGDTKVLFGLPKIGGSSPRRDLLLIHFFSRNPFPGNAASGVVENAVNQSIGPFEFLGRIPARAFLLQGCIPTRYKTGGDFDARSGEVSLMELDIEVERFEQISLTA